MSNFNKLLKGESYNIPIKISANNTPIVLEDAVTYDFYTPEQLPIEAPLNQNNIDINRQDLQIPSEYIEPLLISEGQCYQDTNDSSIWYAPITVPDTCKESQEGYEFYSLTFYFSYKSPQTNKIIQKEVQKLFTVHENHLTTLTENRPYVFSYNSHLTGNILLPQPHEIEAVNVEVINPKTNAKIYTKYVENPVIYKQNEKYNIYTFITGETIQTLKENSCGGCGGGEQWMVQYSYTLKTSEGGIKKKETKTETQTETQTETPETPETPETTAIRSSMKQVYHLINPVYLLSPKIAMMIKDLKFEIEKGGVFNVDQYLVWRDHDIYEALLLGLNRINGTHPVSSVCYCRSLEQVPEYLMHAVRIAGLVELYKAWFLAESLKKFDFTGMDISLSVDNTRAIRELIDLNNKWLDDNVSDTKKYITSNFRASVFRGTINYNTAPIYSFGTSLISGLNII